MNAEQIRKAIEEESYVYEIVEFITGYMEPDFSYSIRELHIVSADFEKEFATVSQYSDHRYPYTIPFDELIESEAEALEYIKEI